MDILFIYPSICTFKALG